MINTENLDKWLDVLATTELPQGRGKLRSMQGYCCLGIGCVVMDGELRHIYRNYDLAPREFMDWLGIEILTTSDVTVDWPYDYARHRDVHAYQHVTGSWLNDEGFTFSQIADIIRYFGVKEKS